MSMSTCGPVQCEAPISNPAEIGSLLIEYGTLTKLTGKKEYYDKAKRAVVELYKRQSKIGLVGSGINVETGQWTDSTAGIMGGIDSYYEYLLKASILFGDGDCERMWKESITAINGYLADERPDDLWYGQADMNTGKRTTTYYGALDAFFPAVLVLSQAMWIARLNCSSQVTRCGTLQESNRTNLITSSHRLRTRNIRYGQKSSSLPTISTTQRTTQGTSQWGRPSWTLL